MYFKKKPSYFNYSLQNNILKICKCEYNYFFNKKNVQGIGCGYKVTKGFRTEDLSIQVFVSKKFSKLKISKKDMIPSTFKGIKTDIIESGFFIASSLKDRIRPVQGGYSISSVIYKDYYGTAGCLVTNGVLNFILSTNHSIANDNKVPLKAPIIQPAFKYGGYNPRDTVGTLHKFIPLRFMTERQSPINLSDCAIALVTNSSIVSPIIAFIGKLKGIKSAKLNSQVKKVGSISELTQGTVTSVGVSFIGTNLDESRCLFENQIFTNRMSDQGDSGSILVNNNNYAIGLLIASGDNITAYSRIDIVLDQLDVHIVT